MLYRIKREEAPTDGNLLGLRCAYTLSFHFLAGFTIAYASYHFKILLTKLNEVAAQNVIDFEQGKLEEKYKVV